MTKSIYTFKNDNDKVTIYVNSDYKTPISHEKGKNWGFFYDLALNQYIEYDKTNLFKSCQYCQKVFSKTCNRSRHEKICLPKIISEKNTIILLLQEKLKAKDEIIQSKEKEIEFLKDNITENRKQNDKVIDMNKKIYYK
jgi:hypothetical protein